MVPDDIAAYIDAGGAYGADISLGNGDKASSLSSRVKKSKLPSDAGGELECVFQGFGRLRSSTKLADSIIGTVLLADYFVDFKAVGSCNPFEHMAVEGYQLIAVDNRQPVKIRLADESVFEAGILTVGAGGDGVGLNLAAESQREYRLSVFNRANFLRKMEYFRKSYGFVYAHHFAVKPFDSLTEFFFYAYLQIHNYLFF